MDKTGVLWASSMLIILFAEMLNLFFLIRIIFLKENKESDGIFGNTSFAKMESSKLLN
jgi:hypothetical protein